MAKMARNSKFTFVGELKFGKEIMATRQLGDSKWSSTRCNVMVKNDQNAQFLNIEYMHEPDMKTVKIFTKDNEMVDVDLSMTTNKDVVKNAADFVKTTIDVETDFEKKKEYTKLIFKRMNHDMKKDDEKTQEDLDKIEEYTKQIEEVATNRYEFAHAKDVMTFLESYKEELDGKRVRVTGSVKTNYYNGKTSLQYVPSLIELVDDTYENKLIAEMDFFYDKDGLEDDKDLKKVIVSGYIMDRIKKQDKLVPLQTIIDYSKVDLENKDHVMLLDFMKGIFDIKDKKQVHKMGVQLSIVNGRIEEEFSEKNLTDHQRMCILLGKNTLNDFKPKGNIYGERISELKVINGDYKVYPNGSEDVFAIKELDDYLVVTQEEIKEIKEETKKDEVIDNAAKIANLFG